MFILSTSVLCRYTHALVYRCFSKIMLSIRLPDFFETTTLQCTLMGIICICPNGHRTKLKDRFAGLRVRCPQCGEKFRVAPHDHQTREQTTAISPSISQAEFDSPFSDDGSDSRHLRAQPTATAKQSAGTVPSILDEDPSQLWRIAPPGGEPSSAMKGPELLALFSSSKIKANVYVWRTDWLEWKPVKSIFPDFF
jgi:hypothetical protein